MTGEGEFIRPNLNSSEYLEWKCANAIVPDWHRLANTKAQGVRRTK